MREEIAGVIYHRYGGRGVSPSGYILADIILTLISEKIEKGENPYQPLSQHARPAFEDCRQKILSLLR